MTLDEMVRQEKFGGGASDQKNLDAEMAAQIARDGRFQADLEYMDENSERLARKRMRTDAMKRAFAINGELLESILTNNRLQADAEGARRVPILLARRSGPAAAARDRDRRTGQADLPQLHRVRGADTGTLPHRSYPTCAQYARAR